MVLETIASSFLRPGTKLVELSTGGRVAEIASHNTIYIIGTGSLGVFQVPTQIVSVEDFINQFGASLSEPSIRTLFREYKGANVFFVRAAIADIAELSITGTTVGTVNFTINTFPVAVTVATGATTTTIAQDVMNAINTTTATAAISTAYATSDPSKIRLVSDIPGQTLTIVETSTILTVTDFAPTAPSVTDFIQAIGRGFDAEDGWSQGFLVAPEAFSSFANASDRLAVGNAMELLAASEGFDWMALVDNHSTVTTPAQLNVDATQYVSALGHLAYFAPYLVTLEDQFIPPSAVIAASACKKYSVEGFQEPIGGTRYKLSSVKDVAIKYVNQQQDSLNPIGINLVRNLKNKGICIWGMRTRASDSNYRFIHTRVIMNVVNGTLRSAFDSFLFSSIDGIGILLHRIEETAYSVGLRLWLGRALFGATPDAAFSVVCNFTNNNNNTLETGTAILQFYCAPVPGLERLLLATYRVKIGDVPGTADGSI
jgi:uncharacterized protein